MEQFAAAVDGGAPPDERTTAQAVALLAADAHETQRRQEEEAAAAAEASGGRRCRWRWRVPLGSRAAPPAAPRQGSGVGARRGWRGGGDGGGEGVSDTAAQMRATVVSELKEMSSGGGVAPLFAAVSASAAASALPARSRRLLAMGVELATLHVEKKLAGRRAAKFNLALSLLPHKSIASLLQNTTPERAARSATALLLARPAGGPNLLQRLLAIALDIDKREAAYRAAARGLPPAAQRTVAWLHDRRADHGLLPTAAAIDSAAKVSALLVGAATAAGVDAADLAAELRRQPTAVAQASTALAHGQQLAGSRAVVALLGEPQMDDLVSGLSPVLHEPLMRVVLRGDVKRLLGGRGRPLGEAMLRAAANERLPRQQRHAAFDLALRDVLPTASASPTRCAPRRARRPSSTASSSGPPRLARRADAARPRRPRARRRAARPRRRGRRVARARRRRPPHPRRGQGGARRPTSRVRPRAPAAVRGRAEGGVPGLNLTCDAGGERDRMRASTSACVPVLSAVR